MTDVQMSSDIRCELIRHMADDEFVIQAAKVSNKGWNEVDPSVNKERFLNALMKPRHGVPWEHTYFTFFVEVPIFVARQWVKHRISSMNEMSGRYTKMVPTFYTPPEGRPMQNVGTKMKPNLVAGTEEQKLLIAKTDRAISQAAWDAYQERLDAGVAEELARTVLPLNTFTQFYWSLNGRSVLNFLERRVESEDSLVPTHPQWEIDLAARMVEQAFADAMPVSHQAFVQSGRVAP